MNEDKRYWLDEPRNVRRIVVGLVIACLAAVVPDLFYTKHPHFAIEGWFGFYAWYGFVSCLCVVALGVAWRRIAKRDEDYYDRRR